MRVCFFFLLGRSCRRTSLARGLLHSVISHPCSDDFLENEEEVVEATYGKHSQLIQSLSNQQLQKASRIHAEHISCSKLMPRMPTQLSPTTIKGKLTTAGPLQVLARAPRCWPNTADP